MERRQFTERSTHAGDLIGGYVAGEGAEVERCFLILVLYPYWPWH
jgi:hypothetical protein